MAAVVWTRQPRSALQEGWLHVARGIGAVDVRHGFALRIGQLGRLNSSAQLDLLQQSRQAAVGERLPARLARRAILQRRVGERHLADHIATDRTLLAGPAVHGEAGLLLFL